MAYDRTDTARAEGHVAWAGLRTLLMLLASKGTFSAQELAAIEGSMRKSLMAFDLDERGADGLRERIAAEFEVIRNSWMPKD